MKTPTRKKIFVEQLENKNQFVIEYCEKDNSSEIIAFQSYRTVIAVYYPYTNKLEINWHYWDYSKTTLKHLKMFINWYTCYKYENKKQFLNLLLSNNEKITLFE